jgi:transcriptional regulator with XRE-family HTH domain
MDNLISHRRVLGLSQSKLARLSGVSRWRINNYELGGEPLTPAELEKITAALHAETERLRNLSGYLDALANLARRGAESPDPGEIQAAATILANDAPRGLRASGCPAYGPAAGGSR